MRQEDFKAFRDVVGGFAEIKGKQLSAPAIELYWRAMQNWSIEDFRAAAEHLLRTCEFMPTPKNFEDLRRAGQPTPSEAWMDAMSNCLGWRDAAKLPGGRLGRAVAAVGGWERLAMADTERDLPHIQRRFLTAYEELSDVEEVREALPMIANEDDHLLEHLSVPRLERRA